MEIAGRTMPSGSSDVPAASRRVASVATPLPDPFAKRPSPHAARLIEPLEAMTGLLCPYGDEPHVTSETGLEFAAGRGKPSATARSSGITASRVRHCGHGGDREAGS